MLGPSEAIPASGGHRPIHMHSRAILCRERVIENIDEDAENK